MSEEKEVFEILNAQFVSPAKTFLGDELAPYTEGSRILLSQIRDDSDTPTYFVWCFVFLHVQLKKDRKKAVKLAWDKQLFREALIEFVSDKSESDRDIAIKLVSSVLDDAKVAVLEPEKSSTDNQSGN